MQYLATEKMLLAKEDARITDAESFIADRKASLEAAFAALPETAQSTDTTAAERTAIAEKLRELQNTRRTIESRISRLEGMIEAHRQMRKQEQTATPQGPSITFAPTEYTQLLGDIELFLAELKSAQTLDDTKQVYIKLERLIAQLKSRSETKPAPVQTSVVETTKYELKDTALEMEALERELKALIAEEEMHTARLAALEKMREENLLATQESTRKRYEIKNELTQCDGELQILAVSKASFLERKEYFDAELKEAAFLFGPAFVRTLQDTESVRELNIAETKRAIDRLKIRLDEHSGIGNEVLTEYESTKERDEFLAREVTDIEASIRNLETLIIDLKKILDEKFTSGVAVINERFSEFFKTMFGGGSAFLSITVEKKRRKKTDESLTDMDEEQLDENDERFFERGIEVHVNLPEKKVKELQMLSGGERSLVSIALLFAISQVNPPPFLVLDETDAALDEANSRRYGDMIEKLSAYSQLIVVTHNRETMSRATVLYGVTLGSDSASKLLSIKFDEAVKVAK